MIRSMTGFASASGAQDSWSWSWELRAVNGKGLDLRLRMPDWIEGLEVALRKQMTADVARGNITCNLRISSTESAGSLQVNTAHVDVLLDALHEIETRAIDAGVSLAPSRASDILTMRGVLEQTDQVQDIDGLREALLSEFPALLSDFNAMRRQEGAVLAKTSLGKLKASPLRQQGLPRTAKKTPPPTCAAISLGYWTTVRARMPTGWRRNWP